MNTCEVIVSTLKNFCSKHFMKNICCNSNPDTYAKEATEKFAQENDSQAPSWLNKTPTIATPPLPKRKQIQGEAFTMVAFETRWATTKSNEPLALRPPPLTPSYESSHKHARALTWVKALARNRQCSGCLHSPTASGSGTPAVQRGPHLDLDKGPPGRRGLR